MAYVESFITLVLLTKEELDLLPVVHTNSGTDQSFGTTTQWLSPYDEIVLSDMHFSQF